MPTWQFVGLGLLAMCMAVAVSVALVQHLRGKTEVEVVVPEHRPLRVAFLGDSITHGSYVSRPENTFVARVAAWLDAQVDDVTTDVVAVSGQTSTDALGQRFPKDQDVVVVMFGNNDLYRTSAEQFDRDFPKVVARAEEASPNAQIVCLTPWLPPDYAAAAIDTIERVCSDPQREVVDDAPGTIFLTPENRSVVGEKYQGGRVPDSGHPNDNGHREIAESIIDHIVLVQP